jgi:hypothetical protein
MESVLRNRGSAPRGQVLAGVFVLLAAGGRDVPDGMRHTLEPCLDSGRNGAAVRRSAMTGPGLPAGPGPSPLKARSAISA